MTPQKVREIQIAQYYYSKNFSNFYHIIVCFCTFAFCFLICRRQLRKAVVDHVSDSFLEPDTPLLMLLAAAREGHEKQVEEFGDIFTDHASKLVEVANLACSMSNHEDGVKMVRYAAAQIENLCPQVSILKRAR